MRVVSRLAVSTLTLAILVHNARAQTTGTVEGMVSEAGSGRPLAGVQVFVAGTSLGVVSASNGSFRIASVPARRVELRMRLLGYGPLAKSATVPAGAMSKPSSLEAPLWTC